MQAAARVIPGADKSRCRFPSALPGQLGSSRHKKPSHRREVTFGIAYYTHIILAGPPRWVFDSLSGGGETETKQPREIERERESTSVSRSTFSPWCRLEHTETRLVPLSWVQNLFLHGEAWFPLLVLATAGERIRARRPRCRN